jgi:hypothetical protein
MMQRKIITTGVIFVFLLMGCASKHTIRDHKNRSHIFRIQVGTNIGGVVENTDLTLIEDAGVDAFSGATRRGINTSGKVMLPLKRNFVETGIDLMYNSQTFTYNDAVNGFVGERRIGATQFMIPITYSIGFFKENNPGGLFQVKFGYTAQINLFSISDGHGNMPGYSTNSFSNGATIGLSTTPFRFENGARLGLFVDGYRGTRAYEDFYNRADFEIPGTSFIKYGIIYQF